MRNHTTVRSPGAIALGSFCFIGTLVVLFGHVRALDDLTVNHLYILLALLTTYGAGHFMWDAFAEGWRGFVRGCAFTVLFVVGTVVCVGLSGGRSAGVLENNEAAASYAKAKRLNHEGKIVLAKAEADAAKAAADKAQVEADAAQSVATAECNTGKGLKCDGKTQSAQAAAARAKAMYARFERAESWYHTQVVKLDSDELKPPHVANAELKNLARVYAHLRGLDETVAMASIMLLLPFALALLTEFGSIVFLKHGFGRHKRPAVPKDTEKSDGGGGRRELPATPAATVAPRLVRAAVARTERDGDAGDAVFKALEAAKRPVTNDELAALLGVNKDVASKRVRALDGKVHKVRVGRHVAISLVGDRLH